MYGNECIPKYEPGEDLTGYVTQAGGVLGKRFLALSGDKRGVEAVSDDTTGGNVQVAYPAAGAKVFGVSGYDCDLHKLVKVVRGAGEVVPVSCADDCAFDEEVEVNNVGQVVPLDTGRAVGRTIRSAVAGGDALVELYGVSLPTPPAP